VADRIVKVSVPHKTLGADWIGPGMDKQQPEIEIETYHRNYTGFVTMLCDRHAKWGMSQHAFLRAVEIFESALQSACGGFAARADVVLEISASPTARGLLRGPIQRLHVGHTDMETTDHLAHRREILDIVAQDDLHSQQDYRSKRHRRGSGH
jgi:hypothetical protein